MKNNYLKTFCLAFLAGISSIMLFAIYFKLWQINLNYPIIVPYGDVIGINSLAKNIIDNGWITDSNRFGYLNSESFFTFNHYPLYSEYIHFSIFKIFSFFTQNPYLIVNLFFILTFFLISFFGFLCLRVYGISNLISFLLAIYYAFLSYHFHRSTYHAFLSNYSCFPLIMMVVYWFYNNQITLITKNQKQQFCLAINKYFIFSVLIIIYCSGTGFYYALYSYLLILLVWFLKSLKDHKFISKNLTIFLVFMTLIIVLNFCLYLPHFLFLSKYKYPNLIRDIQESFFYGLKMVSLFIPQRNHLIENFANIGISWKEKNEIWENSSCYLGILLGSIFIKLILWPFIKASGYQIFEKTIKRFALNNSDVEKISLISFLNFSGLLFVIPGGLIALSFKFVFLRSNARFVVVIAFLCLIVLGILVDGLLRKKNLKNFRLFKITLFFVYIVSMLDITGKPIIVNYDIEYYYEFLPKKKYSEYLIDFYEDLTFKEYNSKIIKIVDSNVNFVEKIESVMPANSAIFVMPYTEWPERPGDSYSSMIFYLHSKKLRWSYPLVITNNNAEVHKRILKNSDFNDFIANLKKLGFSGLVLNVYNYDICVDINFKAIGIKDFKEKMIQKGGKNLIKSDNGFFMFIKI
jgi:hypothetical protein